MRNTDTETRQVAPDAPLLETRRLAITAGGKTLHGGLSCVLAPGELVAVTGPSGAGKTTLLRTVTGLQDAASGVVLLQGRTPGQWGWPEFRRRVVLVSQKPILLEMSVEDNLRRPFAYHTASAPFPQERARELMDELGVGAERMGQDARSLSVGQGQRVSLIRALLLEPPVLCLDEPTSALDPDSSDRVQRLISALSAGRGLAALIVTHSAEQAQCWCSRRIALAGDAL